MKNTNIPNEINNEIHELEKTGHFQDLNKYIAHGKITVLEHVISVTDCCLKIVNKLNLKVDHKALIRASLLHDYYLYDWHINEKGRPLHGFYHQYKAAENAKRDYQISDFEADIIKSHMFPLPIHEIPKSKEAWIITIADKIVATNETLFKRK